MIASEKVRAHNRHTCINHKSTPLNPCQVLQLAAFSNRARERFPHVQACQPGSPPCSAHALMLAQQGQLREA